MNRFATIVVLKGDAVVREIESYNGATGDWLEYFNWCSASNAGDLEVKVRSKNNPASPVITNAVHYFRAGTWDAFQAYGHVPSDEEKLGE